MADAVQWFHAYGAVVDGTGWVQITVGPTDRGPESVRSGIWLCDLLVSFEGHPLPWLAGWDHEPTEVEKEVVQPSEYRDVAEEDLVIPARHTPWLLEMLHESVRNLGGDHLAEELLKELGKWSPKPTAYRSARQSAERPGDRDGLPSWAEMTDLDRGAALLHLRKRETEGGEYAAEHYPARYVDDPRLRELDDAAASCHAASMSEESSQMSDSEWCRLYELALAAERG